jgi:hypothetical protein
VYYGRWGLVAFADQPPVGSGTFVIAPHADATSGIRIAANGNVGFGTATPLAKVDVNGTVRAKAVELTGGADIAEAFDVAGEPQPGMVVRPDPGQSCRRAAWQWRSHRRRSSPC